MGRVRKAVGRVTEKSAEKRLPKGALKFPFLLQRPKEIDFAEIEGVRKRFGVSDIFRVHGMAFKTGNRTIVVIGPQGVGKSTLLRQVAAKGTATPIEDGEVVLARNASQNEPGFKVIETGRHDFRTHISKISKALRTNVGFGSPYRIQGLSEKAFRRKYAWGKALGSVSELAGRLSYRRKSNEPFSPKSFGLSEVVWIQSRKDKTVPRQVVGKTISKTTKAQIVEELKKAGIRVWTIDSTKPDLKKDIEKMIYQK